CSPAPLMFLLAMVNSGKFELAINMAVTLGMVALLAMVAVAVGFFIRTNQYQAEVALIENYRFELAYGVHGVVTDKQRSFQEVYNKRLAVGIALFICSVIPLLVVAVLSGSPDTVLLMLVVLFILIAVGLALIVPASARFEAHKLLLCEGDRDADKSEHTKNAERLAPFYWPLVIAIYLGWSLWTMDWGVTWIVFPVAAVAFAAMAGLMGLLKKEETR
ncbi:MAG: hypothetical protein OIF34_02335, partial [Porticoccaceae bacterium]|nr:hypothetical protein [Porticoccaceae bacterium]